MAAPANDLLPPKLRDLFFRPGKDGKPIYVPSRYKVPYGGRGGAKSWGIARVLSVLSAKRPLRVLCARELQNSIQESVHRVLSDQIEALGLTRYFDIQQQGIYGVGPAKGTEFIFAGIRNNVTKIKSTEGVDICWVEEAEKVSEASWKVLIPTIRKRGSEIWVSFNPHEERDPTFQRFVVKPPPSSMARVVKIDWRDNPWFPPELELERKYALSLIENAQDDDERAQAQADYDHVWEGATINQTQAAIFRKRVVIEAFDTPTDGSVRYHYGADWGFANDPTALIRFWVDGDVLRIDREAFGYGVEIDELPKLFDTVEGARDWPIKADCARPETISYMRRQGFNISAADKWPGSVEDGIAHIKGFRRIVIHERCKHMQEEARLYSYKVDRVTGDILPVIVDKWNHGWDAVRYGLDGFIQARGGAGVWARLAE